MNWVENYQETLNGSIYPGDDLEESPLLTSINSMLFEQDQKILNIYMLGEDEAEHAQELLKMIDPPVNSVILDCGCGFGEMARLMRESRSDLRFILQNISSSQLERCPDEYPTLLGDFHKLDLEDRSVDVVMFCYSLGHGMVDQCLKEAFRVLKDDGVCFVYDIRSDDGKALLPILKYQAYRREDVLNAAKDCGFQEIIYGDIHDKINKNKFKHIFGDCFDALLQNVTPCWYRFRKIN